MIEIPDNDTVRDEMSRGIGVGIAMGTGVGILMENLPMWMAIGTAVGIALGTRWSQ